MLIGVDGGGTGCRAIIADQNGHHLGTGTSGPANIMTSIEGARNSILEAISSAFQNAGYPRESFDPCNFSVFMGLAGANIGNYAEKLKASLPFRQTVIETDAVTSLEGAIGSKNGAAAIIGTGTVFIYRYNTIINTIGGWGLNLGDHASGAWIGRYLLQETLLCYDKVHQGSALTRYIIEEFDNEPQNIVEFAHTAKPKDFGKFAPLIFEFAEKQDSTANKIISLAVTHIEEILEVILTNTDGKFCMLGGLGSLYKKKLSQRYQKQMSPPLGNAVNGAVKLAVKEFTDRKTTPCPTKIP